MPSESFLYRRISPQWYCRDSAGGWRVTTAAFQDLRGSLSVAIGVVLERHNRRPEDVIAKFPGYGLYRLTAGFVRSLGLGVVLDPTDEEQWHGSIYGKKTGSIKARLAVNGEWVVRPAEPASGSDAGGPSFIVESIPEWPPE